MLHKHFKFAKKIDKVVYLVLTYTSYTSINFLTYETTGMGYRIGNISVNSTACADDIALFSEEQDQVQILINMAYDYAYLEGYELQPSKSIVLNISPKQCKQ